MATDQAEVFQTVMDPSHLRDEEVQYELELRVDRGAIDEGLQTPVDQLRFRLDKDKTDGVDPWKYDKTFTVEQASAEITHCYEQWELIADENEERNMSVTVDELRVWSSRLFHYFHRANRIVATREVPAALRGSLQLMIPGCKRALLNLEAEIAQMVGNLADQSITDNLASSTLNENAQTNQNPVPTSTPPADENGLPINAEMGARQGAVTQQPALTRMIIPNLNHSWRDMSAEAGAERARDLHRRVIDECLKPGAPKRVPELQALLQEVADCETHFRSIPVMNEEEALSHRIFKEVGGLHGERIILNQAIAEANRILQARTLAPNQLHQAHSTMRENGMPSVALLEPPNGLDPISQGNWTLPASPENREVRDRALAQSAPRVTFAPDVQVRDQTFTASQPLAGGLDTGIDITPLTSLSTGAQPLARSLFTSSYHPSTPRVNTAEPTSAPLGQSIPNRTPERMQFHQKLQCMSRALGNRRFDGSGTDGKGTLRLDEFISHLRQYQFASGLTDSEVLQCLSTVLEGKAFNWWSTEKVRICTLNELEARLKKRFENQLMDPMSLIMKLSSRVQGKDEYLLDYIDEMKVLASHCADIMPESNLIAKIIDNSHDRIRGILSARTYNNMSEFIAFAEYNAGRVTTTTSDKKPIARKTFSRAINAVEVEGNSESEDDQSVSEYELASEEIPDQGKALIDMVTRLVQNQWNGKPNKGNRSKSDSRKGNSVPSKSSGSSNATAAVQTKVMSTEAPAVQMAQVQPQMSVWPMYQMCMPMPMPMPNAQSMSPARVATTEKTVAMPSTAPAVAEATSAIDATDFGCFGCQTPGVYKRNCPKCNPHLVKNAKATQ